MLRDVDDIFSAQQKGAHRSRLHLHSSSLPTLGVHSIIPDGNFVLQMTTSWDRRVNVDVLQEIRQKLGHPESILLVFVAPYEEIGLFTGPSPDMLSMPAQDLTLEMPPSCSSSLMLD